jgi:hypothetical protein
MIWPSSARTFDFDDVHESYRLAAVDVRGVFIPAGDAWREVWRRNPRAVLYGPDGFHPTPFGSYVAAAMMFEALFDRPPAGVVLPDITAEEARLARAAVDAVWQSGRQR